MNAPWVEKYRPRCLADVSAQEQTIAVLTRTLQSANLPHLLFYGSPGTGKTSTVLALAQQLYGPKLMKSRVLELNASDERGISIVRAKIKDFARSAVTRARDADAQYPCPPYKLIILDEADNMTQDAQSALRRTMELYSKITRFCLICNYVSRIIDPLASRCSKFRFKPLDDASAAARLQEIAQRETLNLAPGVVGALIESSHGDLRRAITYLQSAARTIPVSTVNEDEDEDDAMEMDQITVESIREIAGRVPEEVMMGVLAVCEPGKGRTLAYQPIATCVDDLIADGWSISQFLSQLHDLLLLTDPLALSSKQKGKIAWAMSETDKRLADGADEQLEVLDLLLKITEARL